MEEKRLKIINYDILEKRGKNLVLFFAILLFVTTLSLLSLIFVFPDKGSLLSYRTNIPSQWVAIYLNDGATLYGHIASIGITAFKLDDVYVLDKFIGMKNEENNLDGQSVGGSSQNFSIKQGSNIQESFSLAKQKEPIVIKNRDLIYWEIINDASDVAKILNEKNK